MMRVETEIAVFVQKNRHSKPAKNRQNHPAVTACSQGYAFTSRLEDGDGTNPEELFRGRAGELFFYVFRFQEMKL